MIGFQWLENRFLFHPAEAKEFWQPKPIDDIQDATIPLTGDLTIHAWYLPQAASERTVLLCHGNAGNVSMRPAMLMRLRGYLDASVCIFDYPGYGWSGGRPTEAGCYQSAAATYDWLTGAMAREPARIVLVGESLGGAVAVELATRVEHHSLILIKTFTSVPDVAKFWMPLVPSWIMTNQFDSLRKIRHCTRPTLIAGATDDSVVPYPHSRTLFDACRARKAFVSFAGDDHNDPLPDDFYRRVRHFIDGDSV